MKILYWEKEENKRGKKKRIQQLKSKKYLLRKLIIVDFQNITQHIRRNLYWKVTVIARNLWVKPV